jgi:hypothetical protein
MDMTEDLTPTPREEILGSGAGGPLPQPSQWTTGPGYVNYPYAVTIGNPTGGAKGAGSLNLQSLYIQGTLVDLTKYLPFTGGTLTGTLTLAGDPVNPLDAADKRYIDTQISAINTALGTYLPIAGGTITGNLTISGTTTLSADPTLALQASTKQYVDAKFAGLIAIPDAPSDGSTYGRNNGAWTNVIDMGTY